MSKKLTDDLGDLAEDALLGAGWVLATLTAAAYLIALVAKALIALGL